MASIYESFSIQSLNERAPHFKQRLPRNASIFTAEVTAIDLALYTIVESDDDHFIISSDSLSVLFITSQ